MTQTMVVSQANALVSTGLAAKGYTTVSLDEGWQQSARVGGHLVSDPTRFASGITWLCTQIHALGLKCGLYVGLGTFQCDNVTNGSVGNYTLDAADIASWGADFVKADGCNMPSVSNTVPYIEYAYSKAYHDWWVAIKASSNPSMVISESAPAYVQGIVFNWYDIIGKIGQWGTLWREGNDLDSFNYGSPGAGRWPSIVLNYSYNRWLGRYSRDGQWNDPDFVITGDQGISDTEGRSQLSLWAMMGAPLILGSDLTALSVQGLADLKNDDVLSIDQHGLQGYVVSTSTSLDVLMKRLGPSTHAVAIFNRGAGGVSASLTNAQLGYSASVMLSVREIWTGVTGSTVGATIASHATAVFIVNGAIPTATGEVAGYDEMCIGWTGADAFIRRQVCDGTASQRITMGSDSTFHLFNGATDQCLDYDGSGNAVLTTCSGATRQQWTYTRIGQLQNVNSSLCLDMYNAVNNIPNAAAPLQVVTCGARGGAQNWAAPSFGNATLPWSCACVGLDYHLPAISTTVACGASLCGGPVTTYPCDSYGFTVGVANCNALGICACQGTDYLGAQQIAACGQNICGGGNRNYLCNSPGGNNFTGPGAACP